MVSCPALSTGYAAAAPAPCAVGQGAQKVSSVLNVDDEYVMQMANRTRQLIVTFGMERDADGRVVQLEEAFPDPLMLFIASRQAHIRSQHCWSARAIGPASPQTMLSTDKSSRTGKERGRVERYPALFHRRLQ
jgi:hypothetical protein